MTARMHGVDCRCGIGRRCLVARVGRPAPGAVLRHAQQLTGDDGRRAGRHDQRHDECLQAPNHYRKYKPVDVPLQLGMPQTQRITDD